jgi:hypothetical protein
MRIPPTYLFTNGKKLANDAKKASFGACNSEKQ